jgi:hypothetical protein
MISDKSLFLFKRSQKMWRHDIEHNDTRQNDAQQQINTQHPAT